MIHNEIDDQSGVILIDHLKINDSKRTLVNQRGTTSMDIDLQPSMTATGHVFMRDIDTNETLVDQHNDIHLENFSEAIALSLANYDKGVIEEMHFGNGGTLVTSTDEIHYSPPVVTGQTADLYNPTYVKVVNNRSSNFKSDAAKVNVATHHVVGTRYTDIVVTCTLDYGEPADQLVFDNADTTSNSYIFDELGLKSHDVSLGVKRLLTHVIFHPVQKSLNRAIEVVYTIRITMV